MLLKSGDRCWTITNDIPVSPGKLSKNRSMASRPPADAPMPTTCDGVGEGAAGSVMLERVPRSANLYRRLSKHRLAERKHPRRHCGVEMSSHCLLEHANSRWRSLDSAQASMYPGQWITEITEQSAHVAEEVTPWCFLMPEPLALAPPGIRIAARVSLARDARLTPNPPTHAKQTANRTSRKESARRRSWPPRGREGRASSRQGVERSPAPRDRDTGRGRPRAVYVGRRATSRSAPGSGGALVSAEYHHGR